MVLLKWGSCFRSSQKSAQWGIQVYRPSTQQVGGQEVGPVCTRWLNELESGGQAWIRWHTNGTLQLWGKEKHSFLKNRDLIKFYTCICVIENVTLLPSLSPVEFNKQTNKKKKTSPKKKVNWDWRDCLAIQSTCCPLQRGREWFPARTSHGSHLLI